MPSMPVRSIKTLALSLLLMGICPKWVVAEPQIAESQTSQKSQISGIQLTDTGDLVFNVSGEGFDPQLSVRPLPQGHYQITISAPKTVLKDTTEVGLNQQIQKAIPAIESTLLSQDGVGFQLNFTSWQPLQPQIKSNTSHRVVITLVGSHSRPAKTQALLQSNKAFPTAEASKPVAITNPFPVLKSTQPLLAKGTAQNANIPQSSSQKTLTEKTKATHLRDKNQRAIRPQTAASVLPVQTKTQQKILSSKSSKVGAKVGSSARTPSITPNTPALQIDWQPVYSKSIPPQTIASQQESINTGPLTSEPLNFLGQPADNSPINSLSSHSLQLQKTPAGYQPPTFLPSNASFESDSARAAIPSSSYSPYTSSKEPAIQRATADLTNGHPDNAELGLRALLEREPNHPQATYLLALINLTHTQEPIGTPGSPDNVRHEATRQALEALIDRQAFLPAYQQLIELALVEARWDTAETLLSQALKQFPESAWLWYQQGRLQEGRKDWVGAQAAYTKALALDAHPPEYHYRLAQIHLKNQNWDAARWELNQALAVVPDDPRTIKLLGYLAEKQGKSQQATAAYQAALQPDAMLYYGRLMQQQNRSAEALIMYQAVESIAQKDADLLLSLGTLYTEAKAFPRAQAVLKQLLKIVSDPSDARLTQAKAILKQSKF